MMNEKLKHINKVIKLVNYAYEEAFPYDLDFHSPDKESFKKFNFARQVCQEMGAGRSVFDNKTAQTLLGLLHSTHCGLRDPSCPVWITRTVKDDVLTGMVVHTNNYEIKFEKTQIINFIALAEKIHFNGTKTQKWNCRMSRVL